MPNFAGFQNDIEAVAHNVLDQEPDGADLWATPDRQVFVLAEEVGEVVKEYRRMTSRARKASSMESVTEEVADVVISAYVLAELLGVNLDEAVARKLDIINERGGL